MTGLAQSLIEQGWTLIAQRADIERSWDYISSLMFPNPDRRFRRGGAAALDIMQNWALTAKVPERARYIYDTTAVFALDRLGTGVQAICCPDNEKWQGLKIDDPFGYEMNDAETKWAERQRDYLFSVRYDPRSGWSLANQAAIRGAAAFGTGLYVIEESLGRDNAPAAHVPYTCTPLALSGCYLTCDAQGFHDQLFRYMQIPARQAAILFGNALSDKVLAMAADPSRANQEVQILHYVGQRRAIGPLAAPGSQPVISVYLETDTKNIVRQSGFGYWPVIVYTWDQVPGSAYGESPAMKVMAEVAGANSNAKNVLLASQQVVRPPIGVVDDGTMSRPNLNPGAINVGALDDAGNLRLRPIFTQQNPQFSQVVLESSRSQIKEGMYTNVWQTLINNPNQTATEALIRANEKGELLGPIGTRIQHGLARLTDAELAILAAKGAFMPGSPLEPPGSMRGRAISVKFASPLDRLRRSGELIGIQQTLGMAASLAQADPSVMDNIDGDEVFRVTREVTGAPAKIMRDAEKVAAIRQGRQQAQQLAASQQMAEIAKTGAQAAQAGVPAVQQLGQVLGAPQIPAGG